MNYCETCKHFQHTGVSSDGIKYDLGGKCEVKPPTRWQGNYCNGGCTECTRYESRED